MKNSKVLTALLALMLAAGLIMAGRHQWDILRGKRDYDEASRLAAVPRLEPASAGEEESPAFWDPNFTLLREVDLDSLRELNADVRGWICIPGTGLSYPVMQGTDNEFYLYHTWMGEKNSVGSIFLEWQVSGDFSDYNTILYGHRMINGTMFGCLREYRDIEYWREHPSVYLVSDSGIVRYDIYAAFEAGLEDPVYRLAFRRQADKEAFIEYGLENSVIETGIAPAADRRVLTLSTCTGRGHGSRWVVQAVERR